MGGDGRGLPGAVFSPEVPSLLPGPHGHGFLTSFVLAPPRPSTRFGSWLVLPGRSRGSEYVCDGPRAARDRGTPAHLSPRPPGCGTSVCSLVGLRFPRRSLSRGRRAVRGPSVQLCPTRLSWPAAVSTFLCRAKTWDRCSERAGRPVTSVGWPFFLFYLPPRLPPRFPCLWEKPVSLTRRFRRTLMGPGLWGPNIPGSTSASVVRSNSCRARKISGDVPLPSCKTGRCVLC